ncbi:HvfC/BufC N-terminal domain-containing protein [Marinobacterium sp. YM272]|uniref:HvfC/BufC N-terminal domain-containing protein n=1 Tax=Marinobacterium sp. YM272 TaxID=3421654 RepID=UPI003D7F9A28
MTTESSFQQALLCAEQPPPDGLTSWHGQTDPLRFDVYRNNVIVSLVDTLASTFAVVQQLVGTAFFRAMAREFLRDPAHLPESPVLAHYGADFPAFIASFRPADSLPFLADVAQLEWLRLQALHAADVTAVDSEDLATQLGKYPGRALRLRFHPAMSLFTSRYAAVSIWAAHQGLLELADVRPDQPEQALILRPGLEVELIPLEPEAAGLIGRLLAGEALPLSSRSPALEAVIQLLLHQGAITGIDASV